MVAAFAGAGVWLRFGGIGLSSSLPSIDPAGAAGSAGQDRRAQRRRLVDQLRQAAAAVAAAAARHCGRVIAAVAVPARDRTLAAFVASSLAMRRHRHGGRSDVPVRHAFVSDPDASLTVWDSVSSHLTLGLMFWAT